MSDLLHEIRAERRPAEALGYSRRLSVSGGREHHPQPFILGPLFGPVHEPLEDGARPALSGRHVHRHDVGHRADQRGGLHHADQPEETIIERLGDEEGGDRHLPLNVALVYFSVFRAESELLVPFDDFFVVETDDFLVGGPGAGACFPDEEGVGLSVPFPAITT